LDLMLLEFTIACITPPLNDKFIPIKRPKARLMIGGWGYW
jgi:hypothetical protein